MGTARGSRFVRVGVSTFRPTHCPHLRKDFLVGYWWSLWTLCDFFCGQMPVINWHYSTFFVVWWVIVQPLIFTKFRLLGAVGGASKEIKVGSFPIAAQIKMYVHLSNFLPEILCGLCSTVFYADDIQMLLFAADRHVPNGTQNTVWQFGKSIMLK
jgi:hypothetical protein